MNYNKIKAFKQKYINECEKALGEIKNKFQLEFEEIIKESLNDDVYICSGMGSTCFYKFSESGKDEEIENKTTALINELIWNLDFNIQLDLPYKMTSKKVLDQSTEDIISDIYKSKGGTYNAIKDGFVSPHLAHIRYFLGWEVNESIISN